MTSLLCAIYIHWRVSDWHLCKYFLSIFQIWTAPASYEELCLRTDVEIWNADTAGEIIILKSLFFVSFHVYFLRLFLFVFCCQEAVFYQRPGGFYHSNWLPSPTRQVIKSFKKSRTRQTIIPGGHVFGRATYNVHVLLEHVFLLRKIFVIIGLRVAKPSEVLSSVYVKKRQNGGRIIGRMFVVPRLLDFWRKGGIVTSDWLR